GKIVFDSLRASEMPSSRSAVAQVSMSCAVLRVLFLDDRETDILPIRHALDSAGLPHTYSVVSTGAELRAALSSSDWDLVICGDSVHELPPLVSLQIVRELAPA